MKRLLCAVVAGLALIPVAAVPAQADLEARLESADKQLGIRKVQETVRGEMAQGATVRHAIQAGAGGYMILGVCELACRDINFKILDRDGTLVEEDLKDDPFPLVPIGAARSTTFNIDVMMVACSQPMCSYAVRVYKSAG